MALSKVDYNSLNVTAAASKALKWNSTPNGFETGDIAGSMILLATETADGSGTTLTFDSDIDSTYKEYIFKYINIHPQTDQVNFTVNFRDGSTAYDATKTTTSFETYHREDDVHAAVAYNTGYDHAQSTSAQIIATTVGNGNDDNVNGTLHLFNPSSTTFVKHFLARTAQNYRVGLPMALELYAAGYCNVTVAIDGVQFAMSSGNIDAGTIKMYGVT